MRLNSVLSLTMTGVHYLNKRTEIELFLKVWVVITQTHTLSLFLLTYPERSDQILSHVTSE